MEFKIRKSTIKFQISDEKVEQMENDASCG